MKTAFKAAWCLYAGFRYNMIDTPIVWRICVLLYPASHFSPLVDFSPWAATGYLATMSFACWMGYRRLMREDTDA